MLRTCSGVRTRGAGRGHELGYGEQASPRSGRFPRRPVPLPLLRLLLTQDGPVRTRARRTRALPPRGRAATRHDSAPSAGPVPGRTGGPCTLSSVNERHARGRAGASHGARHVPVSCSLRFLGLETLKHVSSTLEPQLPHLYNGDADAQAGGFWGVRVHGADCSRDAYGMARDSEKGNETSSGW